MSIFESIADDPKPGDTIVFPGGQLCYEVYGLYEGGVNCYRKVTFREPPYTGSTLVSPSFMVWKDLVRFACSGRRA